MAPFKIELLPEAEDELALLWLNSSDRAALTRTEAKLSELLAADPVNNGRYLGEGLCRISFGGLVFYYTVNHSTRVVQVSNVRQKTTS